MPTWFKTTKTAGSRATRSMLKTATEGAQYQQQCRFARLCGVAPIPVSSGKSHRMRLHRGGNRQANRVIYVIAICRLRYDPGPRPTVTANERRAIHPPMQSAVSNASSPTKSTTASNETCRAQSTECISPKSRDLDAARGYEEHQKCRCSWPSLGSPGGDRRAEGP
jgi:hypothetical protein